LDTWFSVIATYPDLLQIDSTPHSVFISISQTTTNDFDKIDNTWTAKALATVAHILSCNPAIPGGRWTHVLPLKKFCSKKMKMDAQATAAA
jgi:hypothetical protein